MTLLIGIPACTKLVGKEPQFSTPTRYVKALMGTADAVPVLLPPIGQAMLSVLDRLDGILVNGSPSNVHPSLYGDDVSLTPKMHDPARDETTLPLIRAAVDRGVPMLCICRGIQELNVAYGGSLHQQVHDIAGRADHRSGSGTMDEMFRMKHSVRVTGELARIVGAGQIEVNSLHEQALDRVAERLVVEGVADDGTIEAVRVVSARAFAMGVQFHPEWHWQNDVPSQSLFHAFAEACHSYANDMKRAA